MILVSRDHEGVAIAAGELLLEGMRERQERAVRARLKDAAGRTGVPAVERTLSAGYYERAGYLLWLERTVQIAPQAVRLDACDLEGLKVVANARLEFAQEHPPCPRCGTPRESALAMCACGWKPEVNR